MQCPSDYVGVTGMAALGSLIPPPNERYYRKPKLQSALFFNEWATTENKYFDQPFCGKLMRIGAIACAATLAGNVLFLALGDPSHWHCAPAIQKMIGGGPIWGLVAAAGLWAAWLGFLAIKWDWVARRLVDRLERDERLALSDTGVGLRWALVNFSVRRARARLYYFHMIDFGWLLIANMAGSVFLCALPLLVVTVTCLR